MIKNTPTGSYKDRLAVLIECDYNDENHPELSDQTELTRLHDALHSGFKLDFNALTMIRSLSEKLGIQSEKRIQVAGARTRSAFIRFHQVILSRPLGPYYTKISLPFECMVNDAIDELWDSQPIEFAEFSMIPTGHPLLSSERIARCVGVSLQFEQSGFNHILYALSQVTWHCTTLELRNHDLTPQQFSVLALHLSGKWPNLRHITRGSK